MMRFKEKTFYKNLIGALFFAGATYFLVRSFILSWSTDIWYDELFSMEFAKRSVAELVGLTARDVHPPLYYIILRGFLLLFNGTGVSPEIIAKIASIVPFVVLLIYALTVVRANFGMLSAGLFSFMIISMPALPEYTTEIRMYSYAILFVTAALLHGFNLMKNLFAADRKWDIPDSLALWLYTTAAAYTHYYAAVAIGMIYLLILAFMCSLFVKRMKENKASKDGGKAPINYKAIASVIICINLTIVSYIPWLSALLSQVGQVSGGYWIQPVGIRTIGSCIKYMFSAYFSNSALTVVMAVVLFVLAAVLAVSSMVKAYKTRDTGSIFVCISFWVLPLLILFGIAASLLLRPVFVTRYMLPAFGCFYLALAIAMDRAISFDKKEIPLSAIASVLAALVLIVGVVDFKAFIGNEEYRMVNMDKTKELFQELDSDTIIISNFDHVQALLSYYLNGEDDTAGYKIYLYFDEPEELINEMLPGLESIEDSVDVLNLLDSGKKVLFLGSFNSREVILDEWNREYQITSQNLGSYLMERYWFDVFELSL